MKPGITPVPAFIEFFDEYGTICDRDYTIKKVGKGMSGNITVIPGEISKFRNGKAKSFNEKQIIKLLKEAFPFNSEDSADDEDEAPKKKKSSKQKAKKKEPTLEEKLLELDEEQLKYIAMELGVTKKELKGLDDEEEIVELLFSDYDEEDIEEAYESYLEEEDDDDDDE